ncbi:MAG: tyrosine-type recombinase/integrase [Deltaproteobacteria bacterium]|nr:tyrosine-type recombinase/integrase [Deltaproteobacteria bacterium]
MNASVGGALTPEVLAALEIVKRAFGGFTVPSGPTVRELWTKYAAAEKAGLRSWNRSEAAGRRWVALWGDRPAASLTLDDVDEWRATERQRITVRHRPTTPATRNRDMVILRRMLNWGMMRGILAYNPLARVRLEKENNLRETVLTDADVEKIMAAGDPLIRVLVMILFDTGARKMEILRLRWDQVDEASACIRLGARDTKNGRRRHVHLTTRALAAILAIARHPESPYVFANRTGRLFNPRYIYERFQRAVLLSGVRGVNGESVTLHSLRHAFIAKARKLRMPERTVMQQTGHLTRVAYDRYGGLADDDELHSMISIMENGAVSHA